MTSNTVLNYVNSPAVSAPQTNPELGSYLFYFPFSQPSIPVPSFAKDVKDAVVVSTSSNASPKQKDSLKRSLSREYDQDSRYEANSLHDLSTLAVLSDLSNSNNNNSNQPSSTPSNNSPPQLQPVVRLPSIEKTFPFVYGMQTFPPYAEPNGYPYAYPMNMHPQPSASMPPPNNPSIQHTANFGNVTRTVNNTQHVINTPSKPKMQGFSEEHLQDFKHVIYNCLVDNYNDPSANTFVQIYSYEEGGITRNGFKFNELENPEKKLPELYARHLRKARLDLEDQNSVFIQDLYKFYLRACVELLSKYFEKRNKWTYLYEDIPLFVANGSLEAAEERIRIMKTRSRKKKRLV